MRLRKILALAAVGALAAMPGLGQAADCSVDLTSAGPGAPHVADPPNDAQGIVLGDGSGNEFGDVYREGTDVLGGWIADDGEGNLSGHIQLVNASELQPNSIYYLIWGYQGGDFLRRVRWVSALLKGYGVSYRYGYFGDPVTVQSSGTFFTMGNTTGSIVAGSLGTINIDIPKGGTTEPDRNPAAMGAVISNDAWGAPASGATLSFEPDPFNGAAPYGVESAFLVGSPEPLPPPSTIRHGRIYDIDDSSNALLCDGIVA